MAVPTDSNHCPSDVDCCATGLFCMIWFHDKFLVFKDSISVFQLRKMFKFPLNLLFYQLTGILKLWLIKKVVQPYPVFQAIVDVTSTNTVFVNFFVVLKLSRHSNNDDGRSNLISASSGHHHYANIKYVNIVTFCLQVREGVTRLTDSIAYVARRTRDMGWTLVWHSDPLSHDAMCQTDQQEAVLPGTRRTNNASASAESTIHHCLWPRNARSVSKARNGPQDWQESLNPYPALNE